MALNVLQHEKPHPLVRSQAERERVSSGHPTGQLHRQPIPAHLGATHLRWHPSSQVATQELVTCGLIATLPASTTAPACVAAGKLAR